MLTKAIALATKLHHGQHRKHAGPAGIKLPYIVHPLQLIKELWEWGIGDEDMLCATACHDILEDVPEYSKKDLAAHLNHKVADIVAELSFLPGPDEDRQTAKAEYMTTFKDKSVEALVIKLADRFANVGDYLLSRPDYAPKYFHKADVLFDAWRARQKEIIEKFGATTQNRIEEAYRHLVKEVAEIAG